MRKPFTPDILDLWQCQCKLFPRQPWVGSESPRGSLHPPSPTLALLQHFQQPQAGAVKERVPENLVGNYLERRCQAPCPGVEVTLFWGLLRTWKDMNQTREFCRDLSYSLNKNQGIFFQRFLLTGVSNEKEDEGLSPLTSHQGPLDSRFPGLIGLTALLAIVCHKNTSFLYYCALIFLIKENATSLICFKGPWFQIPFGKGVRFPALVYCLSENKKVSWVFIELLQFPGFRWTETTGVIGPPLIKGVTWGTTMTTKQQKAVMVILSWAPTKVPAAAFEALYQHARVSSSRSHRHPLVDEETDCRGRAARTRTQSQVKAEVSSSISLAPWPLQQHPTTSLCDSHPSQVFLSVSQSLHPDSTSHSEALGKALVLHVLISLRQMSRVPPAWKGWRSKCH